MAGGFTALRGERLLTHNFVVAAGTISAGVLGVGFQVLISHHLRPMDYGAVFTVLTILSLVFLPASALTLLMAREVSRDQAQGSREQSEALLSIGNRWLLLAGAALALSIVLASGWLARFFDVSIELLLAAALGVPFALPLPLLMGKLQGAQRFQALSIVVTGQAALKLAGAVALGSVWGAFGVVAGISLASALMYPVVLQVVRPNAFKLDMGLEWRRLFRYLALILPSTIALAVLFGVDVLVVKHLFNPRLAGQYAAVSALGKAMFWGAAGVAGVLFPKIVHKETRGDSGMPLVLASVFLTVAAGALGVAIVSLWAGAILAAFAGAAYVGGAAYLPWYALGMTLLGAAAVLIATQQSRGRGNFLWILLPTPVLEAGLIIRFHSSLTQVVQMVDASMAFLLLGLTIVCLAYERHRLAHPARESVSGPLGWSRSPTRGEAPSPIQKIEATS